MRKHIIALAFALTLSILPTRAFAQQSGMAISPPTFELSGKPGETIKNIVKIENVTDRDMIITPRADNFTAEGDEGQVKLTEEDKAFGLSRWVTFDKDSYTIKPKSSVVVTFTIQIPETGDPGSHTGALIFSTQGSGQAAGDTTKVVQEVGSLILLKLPGDVVEDAKLLSFYPTEGTFKSSQIKLVSLVENNGSVHIKPAGTIEITNFIGSKVKTVEVAGKNILPGSRRNLHTDFTLDGFGSYTAKTTLVYGEGKKLEATTKFFILNVALLVKYGTVAIVLLVVYILFSKRINKALKALLRG